MIYTALTIGPIYKTLGNARHTRELWAASYTFSYLMKKIVEEVKQDPKRTIILPHAAVHAKGDSEKHGEGLFPDRLIYKTENAGEQEALIGIVDGVLDEFAASVADKFSWNRQEVLKFFQNYFRFYIVEKELNESDNPIEKLSPYLDVMELQESYSPTHEVFLEQFFNRINKTFLVKEGYNKERVSYDTLVEISARQFKDESEYKALKAKREHKNYATPNRERPDEDDAEAREDDTKLILDLRRKDGFRAAHKYVAIVLSDGDNVGKIIGGLKKDEEFKKFSEDLTAFALDAARAVHEYGGMPIYAGGDDLLFFAPIINGDENIIDLLCELDKRFVTKFEGYKTSPSPSLSFGVSITYYKYPLFEALEASRNLLYEAKSADKYGTKHNIALRVMKHSGQTFDAVLHIPSGYFGHFRKMLEKHVTEENSILSSITYKIHENEKLFSLIGQDQNKVDNFIRNSFNEPVHEKEDVKEFLKNTKQLISEVFSETVNTEQALDRIYTMLRTISFFKERDER